MDGTVISLILWILVAAAITIYFAVNKDMEERLKLLRVFIIPMIITIKAIN